MPRVVKAAIVRQREILDCAGRLFAVRGYDQTSISDIVDELGISKGAFYHHFESKEALLAAFALRYAEQAAAVAAEILDDESLDCYCRLNGFLARLRRHKIEQATALGNAFAPLYRAENVRLYHSIMTEMMGVVRPLLTRIIAEGVAERSFDTPDPDHAAEIILYLMGATRDQIIALFSAAGHAEREAVTAELAAKLDYVSTVVDRILGLPEGSIQLVDADSVAEITASMSMVQRDRAVGSMA
jgi:AcrR family transcriptional regulator